MTAPFLDPTLPGTSSAIAALLHSLTSPAGAAPLQGASGASGPGGAPVAPQQPAASPPPAAQPPGGITGRIQSLLSHIDPRPQAPPGYEGLLSSEDIQKARPGILASLIGAPGGPSAKEQYENNLNHIVQLHGLATQIAENRRILTNRQAIEAKYPLPPNPTMDEIRNNLAQRYDAYIGAGDAEMAKEIGSSLRGIMSAPKEDATANVPAGGAIVDKKTGKVIYQAPAVPHQGKIVQAQEGVFEQQPDGTLTDIATGKPYTGGTLHPVSMMPSYTFPTVMGPDGQPVIAAANTKTGGVTPTSIGKPGPAASAQNAAAEALLKSSVSEMTKADAQMREYENKLATGQASISGLSQFLGGLGNSFTHDDPASRAIQNTALTALNKVNPDLARYIRRGLSFAEGESGISKRPSDFRTKMAAFLSTASAGAPKDMIADIQSRRNSILDPLHETVGKMGAPPTASGATPLQQKYDAAAAHLKQQGKTPAQILRMIGARP